jgi:hypothetical protein
LHKIHRQAQEARTTHFSFSGAQIFFCQKTKKKADLFARGDLFSHVRSTLQGIVPALYREGSKNVFRIGMFEPIMRLLHDPVSEPGTVPMWKRVIAGATSGAMGAFACNPFELIKTRMQVRHRYRGLRLCVALEMRESDFYYAYNDL